MGITIGDLAQKIMKLMGKEAKIICKNERKRPTKSEVQQLICNNAKARKLINWEPKHSLDQGLLATIEFVKANMKDFRPDAYNI